MFVPEFTVDQIVGYIASPFEQGEARKHTVRCIERAAISAAENGAEGLEQEFTWAASYLNGGDVECVCGGAS